MNSSINQRVEYRDRSHLTRQDFIDEQKYHIEQAELHNKLQHSFGVVRGLILTSPSTESSRFELTPGIAIDREGKVIRLGEKRMWDPVVFDQRGSDRLDVFLQLEVPDVTTGNAEARAEVDRVELIANLVVRIAVARPAERREVYLGRLVREFLGPDPSYRVETHARHQTGVVGASLESPDGQVRLELGTTNRPPNDRRFGVSFSADSSDPDVAMEIREQDDQFHIGLNGETTIEGDLRIRHGGLRFDEELVPKVGPRPRLELADWVHLIRNHLLSSVADEQSSDEQLRQASLEALDRLERRLSPSEDRIGADRPRSGHGAALKLEHEQWMALLEQLGPTSEVDAMGLGDVFAATNDDAAEDLPEPWTIYRARRPKTDPEEASDVKALRDTGGDPNTAAEADTVKTPKAQQYVEQLRFELEAESAAEIVFGSTDPSDGEFKPIMTISNQASNTDESVVRPRRGQVTIHGNLVVEGAIDGEREDPGLSEEARGMLFSGTLLRPQDADTLIKSFQSIGFVPGITAVRKLISAEDDNGRALIADSLLDKQGPDGKFKSFLETLLKNEQMNEERLSEFADAAVEGNGLKGVTERLFTPAKADEFAAAIDELDAGLALTVLQPLLNSLVKKTSGLAAVAAALTSVVGNDATADSIRPIIEALLSKSNGQQAVRDGLNASINDDAEVGILKPIVDLALGKTKGLAAVAASIQTTVAQDASPISLGAIIDAVLNKENGFPAVSSSVSSKLPDDAAANTLQPFIDATIGKPNGIVALSESIGDALPNGALAGVLQPIVDAVFKKANGQTAVVASIAQSVPDNAAANLLQPYVDVALGKEKGVAAVSASIEGVVPNDATATVLQPLVDAVIKKTNGEEAVLASIADAIPDDVAADRLQPLVDVALKKDKGIPAVSQSVADGVANDTTSAELQPLVNVVIGKVNGIAAVAESIQATVADGAPASSIRPFLNAVAGKENGLQALADTLNDSAVVPADIEASKLKPIAEALLAKDKGPEATVSTKPRRAKIIEGLIERFEFDASATNPSAEIRPFANELVTVNEVWATGLRDELTNELT